MADRGVKVYAVQATTANNVVPFYARLAERSGGLHLTFKSFDLITRMFLAVCYREAGRLGEYQAEGRRGARGAEMGEILDSMAKPNEKMTEKSKIVCPEPWFTETVDKAKGKRPTYFYDPTRDMFFSFSEEKYGKFLDKEKYSIGMEKAIDEQFQVRKWADLLTDVDRITQYTSGTCAPVWKTAPKKAASPKKAAASPRTPKKKTAPPPKAKTPPASSSSGAAAKGGVKRKRVASDTVDVSKRAKKDEMTEREERLQKRKEREEKGEGLKRTYYWHY
uniref:Uncharacterized protein n=1 Tax=Paramoeba aestuarina TaxID=180227 RepID=A0A7S4N8K4_9EUKA